MGDKQDKDLRTVVNGLVDERINAEVVKIKDRARYFLYGLGALIAIVTALGTADVQAAR